MYHIARHHDFFVGIDPDGCVLDTMELKHKECFVPNFIDHYQLQAVSQYAREAWESVNLDSRCRGTNREIFQNARAYPAAAALMVGDAPGDYRAAQANRCPFLPICPGDGEACWHRRGGEGIDRFFRGTFAGAYQQELLAEFERCLPTTPSWESKT